MDLPRSPRLWGGIGLLFLGMVGLAIYNTVRIASMRMPISTAIPVLSLCLPVVQLFYAARLGISASLGPILTKNIFFALSILDTTLITLASMLLQRDCLDCSIHNAWDQWFQNKDVRAIRHIQDALDCCGLRSTSDKAWPFPDKTHGADACVLAYNRDSSCLPAWSKANRETISLAMVIGIASLAVKLLMGILIQTRSGRMNQFSAYWQSAPEDRQTIFPALRASSGEDDHYTDTTPRASATE